MQKLGPIALACAAGVVLAGCGSQRSADPSGQAQEKGTYGVNYVVNVSRPIGGTIRSSDGKVDCGTAGGTANACGPVTYAWNETATFTATADGGYRFLAWAADCTGSGACTVDTTASGPDKSIAAVFRSGDTLPFSVMKIAAPGGGDGTVTVIIPGQPPATCAEGRELCTFAVPVAWPPVEVTLTATPAPGFRFTGWNGGDCTGTGACTVEPSRVWIVYARFEPGPGVMSVTRLTNDPGRDFAPAWRPTGEILFNSNRASDRTNGSDLWEMTSDGAGQHELLHISLTSPWADPGLCPGTVALDSGDVIVKECQVYFEFMRASTSAPALPIVRTAWDGDDAYFHRIMLITGGQNADSFSFSKATGAAAWVPIFYGRYQIRTAPYLSLAGQGSDAYGTILHDPPAGATIQGIGFSPDGTELVAAICPSSCGTGSGPDVFVLDAATGMVRRRLTTSGQAGASNVDPRWSPDGSWIVFTETTADGPGLALVPAGGGATPVRLALEVAASQPAWSPDGKDVAFTGTSLDGNQDVWVVRNVAQGIGGAGATFAIGGTIQGLTGSGLTLATPGQPDLVVGPGSASFAFADRVAPGTTFAVTVKRQPSGPAQVCTVAAGNGRIDRVDVTTIQIACVDAPAPAWRTVSVDGGTVYGFYTVWGTSPNDVWVGGDFDYASGTDLLHWDGNAWTRHASGVPYATMAIWGTSPTDVWAMGTLGMAAHWNGQAWSLYSTATGTTFTGVWGFSSNDVWAVGTGGTVVHWDGLAWSPVAIGTTEQLNSVWGTSSTDLWVAGENMHHWNGSTFTRAFPVDPNQMNDIWGGSAGDAWVCAADGLRHWDGLAWTSVPGAPPASEGILASIWGSAPDDIWSVGSNGVARHWDGTAWSPVSTGTAVFLFDVWAAGPSEAWAVGGNRTILRYSP